jgi:4-hydroxymandelate oxidase
MSFVNLFEAQEQARAKLPAETFDYFAGGANDEVSLRANRRIYDDISLRYRVLVDVSVRSTATTLFGQKVAAPIVIAPMAFQRMAHPDGELAVAGAAHEAGILMTASTFATCCLEDIAAAGGPLWFQLYVHQDRGITQALVERAEASGYKALVLTADVPELGRRERDERHGFSLPPGMRVSNFPSQQGANNQDLDFRIFVEGMRDPSLNWKDVEWICSITKMPIIIKGLVRGDDALLAIEHGAKGVVVSNHGGRQLDTAIAPIKALPEVVQAVQGRIPVLVDGGIRRGTDVLKALALGADAVMLGRPVLWGLTVDGQAGVSRILQLLIAELDLAMALCGATTVNAIARDLVS